MQRVPLAQFEPTLGKRLQELWGEPPNLYKALGNHPKLIAAWTEFSRTLRHDTRTPRALRAIGRCCAHSYSERMSCAPRRMTSSRNARGVRVSWRSVLENSVQAATSFGWLPSAL